MKKNVLSPKLRLNWTIDAALFIGAVLTILTSIYFLIFPVGGYMGGRNPLYGIVIVFDREGWEFLHKWGSLFMILIALIHIIVHWNWIVGTTKRVFGSIGNKENKFGPRLAYNIIIDALIALSFIVCGLTGIYFFFAGEHPVRTFLFSTFVWDMLHTWSGVVMIMTIILHFTLHWKWVVNITKKVFARFKKSEPVLLNQNDSAVMS